MNGNHTSTQNNRAMGFCRNLMFFGLVTALAFAAHATSIPEWLPKDFRFEVEGSSNNVGQVAQTLAAMRESMEPSFRAKVEAQGMMGPCLQWVVRWCRPGVTNVSIYLSRAAHPAIFKPLDFDRAKLTNTIAKLSNTPVVPKIDLVFDDKFRNPVRRAIPGVDYPGVDTEDKGTTPYNVRLVLRAPKASRRFRIHLTNSLGLERNVEYKFSTVNGGVRIIPVWRSNEKVENWHDLLVYYPEVQRFGGTRIAVFARITGGAWGPPSFIYVNEDTLCRHAYDKGGLINYIDYGTFRDDYRLDEKGVIIGFVRKIANDISRSYYSNRGELIEESYPNEMPKRSRKVEYATDGSKLTFVVREECVTHKLEPCVDNLQDL